MDRSDVITFTQVEYAPDATGVMQETRTRRDVFCQVNSVSRDEFFDGGRNGLNPEYQFTLFAYDYQGENECVYNGLPYVIYRVYRGRGDTMELYAERKGGTNGKCVD